jgi:hypothetical protein
LLCSKHYHIINEEEMNWDVAQIGAKRNTYKILIAEPEGKRVF